MSRGVTLADWRTEGQGVRGEHAPDPEAERFAGRLADVYGGSVGIHLPADGSRVRIVWTLPEAPRLTYPRLPPTPENDRAD